jgi:hypothetical protein
VRRKPDLRVDFRIGYGRRCDRHFAIRTEIVIDDVFGGHGRAGQEQFMQLLAGGAVSATSDRGQKEERECQPHAPERSTRRSILFSYRFPCKMRFT